MEIRSYEPTNFFGNDSKLFFIFSRRSYKSMLLFNFNNEMDIAKVSLFGVSIDRAFATRLIVSRSRSQSYLRFVWTNQNSKQKIVSPKISSCSTVAVFQFMDFEERISSRICGSSWPMGKIGT